MEALFTAELCKYIVTKCKVPESAVGIIAPYAKQKSEVLKLLKVRYELKELKGVGVEGCRC